MKSFRTLVVILIWISLCAIGELCAINTRGNRRPLPAKSVEALVAASVTSDMAQEAFEALVPESNEDHHIVSNIALNRSVRLSSSFSADLNYGRFAVDGDETTWVESALEKNDPYLVVDLGSESYIDEVTIISPQSLGDVAAFSTDLKTLAFTRNTSDLNERASWHSAALGAGSHATLHAHATGRYIRVQLLSAPGKRLLVSELIVRGVRLNSREKAFSQCLSGHDGSEVCTSRGVCSRGRCNCGAFYYGSRCEFMRLTILTTCASLSIVCACLFAIFRRYRFRRRRALWTSKKLDTVDSSNGPQEDPEKRVLLTRSPVLFPEIGLVRSRSITPPGFIPTRPPQDDSQAQGQSTVEPFKLHVLFASPLVMLTETEVLPVAPLDVEREIELLSRSLQQGGARGRVSLDVTCATIDAFQSILTIREASVLHISSHCQPDFVALEDTMGAAHLISVEALSNLLRASKPALQSSRLVVLNCCHSANVAGAFVQAGFEHVVALRESMRVRDATAATFTRAFYLALASSHTVGDAFRLAKEAVTLCPDARPDEAQAFLLLPAGNSHDEILWPRLLNFPGPSTFSAPATPFANPCQIPSPCEDFVGRSHELWTVVQMLQRHRLVNVHGRRGSGKTAIVTQLAHHVRLRKSEAFFKDGVFFVSLEAKDSSASSDHDQTDFAQELLCAQIAETLAGFTLSNSNAASAPLLKQAPGSQSALRRTVSKSTRDAALHKFAAERPNSLIILDGLPMSLVRSRVFQDSLSMLLRTSNKLCIVTAGEARFESPILKIFNILCGPLTDLETARLLIRLCHPRLVAPAVSRSDGELNGALGELDDEFEDTARALSMCLVVRSLVGHPQSIRKLAMTVNEKCGIGETFAFTDDMDF